MKDSSQNPVMTSSGGSGESTAYNNLRQRQDDTCPLSIFLVKSGSKGDRLLFRYPFPKAAPDAPEGRRTSNSSNGEGDSEMVMQSVKPSAPRTSGTTDYLSMMNKQEKSSVRPMPVDPHIKTVVELSDVVLSHLFAVKPSLCDQKFEVKINDVRFVGHPICLEGDRESNECRNDKEREILERLQTVNVVFALRANASHDIVDCYHKCSQTISIALESEEKRTEYLSKEAQVMLNLLPDDANVTSRSTFEEILRCSPLAETLQKVFQNLSDLGSTYLTLNKWMSVSFCIPQKVHRLALRHHDSLPSIGPERLNKCFELLRPYHGVLLIVDIEELQQSLPQDFSPAFSRVIRFISVAKNLQELSADADISLSHVMNIVAQLVYWGKATVIFPLCENNKYNVHPLAPTSIESHLTKSFAKEFEGTNLLRLLTQFSKGATVKELTKTLDRRDVVRQITWLLKHRLLIQVHTFIFYIPMEERRSRSPTADEMDQLLSKTNKIQEKSLFHRLMTGEYFDGRRHFEDIMYHEDIDRHELMALVDTFADVLFTAEHDDLAVSQLCPYSHLW